MSRSLIKFMLCLMLWISLVCCSLPLCVSLSSFDQCELPDSGLTIGADAEQALVLPHPLHYIATFKLSKSLGIILSEVNPDGEYDDELSEEDAKAWEAATANSVPGEVFVRGCVPNGQADDMGILGVGDKLSGKCFYLSTPFFNFNQQARSTSFLISHFHSYILT